MCYRRMCLFAGVLDLIYTMIYKIHDTIHSSKETESCLNFADLYTAEDDTTAKQFLLKEHPFHCYYIRTYNM